MHPFRLIHAPLTIVYALHLFLTIALGAALANRPGEESQIALALGLVVGQCLLLAVWLTLPTTPDRRRLPFAFAGVGLWLLLAAFSYRPLFGDAARSAAGNLLCLTALLAVLLSVARLLLGWQLTTNPPAATATDRRPRQFHVRDLLLVTAVFAALCALVRLLAPSANTDDPAYDPSAWITFVLSMSVAALPATALVGVFAYPAKKRAWQLTALLLLVPSYLAMAGMEFAAIANSTLTPVASNFGQPGSLLWGFAFVTRFELNLCLSVLATLAIVKIGCGWMAQPALANPPAANIPGQEHSPHSVGKFAR